MTRMRASASGVINSSAKEYYTERTTLGGLLISEGIVVHPRGKGFPNTPGLWNQEQVDAWKPIISAVHEKGGVFFAQLWHVGRVSVPSQIGGLRPLSATSTPLPGRHLLFGDENGEEEYVPGEAMTERDIEDVVEQYVNAARNAVAVGFDGVELHGLLSVST
jgi:2,4-dienoyl-CoA reductase-like NADH-dependent reductase (Old Yellow Enzyme family)